MVKKYFMLYCIIFAIISGCATQKRCFEKFPPISEIIKKDSIIYKEKIIFKDTTILIKLPSDTVTIDISISKIIEPVTIETKYAKATAQIINNKLKLKLIQKDSEIEIRIDSAIRIAKYWQERWINEKQIIISKEKYIPKIYKDSFRICIVIFAGMFIFVGWKAYKFFKR